MGRATDAKFGIGWHNKIAGAALAQFKEAMKNIISHRLTRMTRIRTDRKTTLG
jgi:hypothetical protein